REQLDRAAIQLHAIQELIGRIAPGLAASSGEVRGARRLVDVQQVTNHPGAARHASLDRTGDRVHEIEVAPSIALGPPDDLLAVANRTPVRNATRVLVRFDERL